MWIEGIGEVVVWKKTSSMQRLFWSTRKRSEAVDANRSAPLPYRGLPFIHHINDIELNRAVILSNDKANKQPW